MRFSRFLPLFFGILAMVVVSSCNQRNPGENPLGPASGSPRILASASVTPWANFLDSSRAIDWSSAGFTIPNFTTNCSVQPTLVANDVTAASNNATAIQNALASCDATHNVVNIPAGTYYVDGVTFGTQGHQVLRGAGPMSTDVIFTSETSCFGRGHALCMISPNPTYGGASNVLPGGSQQCSWTAGLTQGSTTVTLSNCGGTPPVNHMLILDQANDTSDTGGNYVCDSRTPGCTYEGTGSNEGRTINGVTHSLSQVTYITGVTSLGGGSYSVTISPGVYFNNIRPSQSPGAWWSDIVENDGLENMTLDGGYQISGTYQVPDGTVEMVDCHDCWVKNVRSLNSGRDSIDLYQSMGDVIRDSYFYQGQTHVQVSYTIETNTSSAFLVENNIFQQVTNAVMFNQGTGAVIDYNFSIDDLFGSSGQNYATASYAGHNAGNAMNLWEGNSFLGIWSDDAWGATTTTTLFRNLLKGWEGEVNNPPSDPVILRSYDRAFNLIGNVLGEPGFHNQYQAYASSPTGGVGAGNEGSSIYSLGWAFDGSCGTGGSQSPYCDPLVLSTLMRWGNYDTFTGGVNWNANEASPAAVSYLNGNFSSSYFSSLALTLPASLYYTSSPAWWPSGKAWPPIGPDVASGNLGICSGTYAGAEATVSTQCAGGGLTGAWAAHANAIPAEDCFLNVMHGAPDGTGSALNFDANLCYGSNSGTLPTPTPTPTPLNSPSPSPTPTSNANGAAALVQNNSNASNSNSVSVSFNSPNTAGDFILVHALWAGSGAVTGLGDSLGNNYQTAVAQSVSPSGNSEAIYYAANILGGSNTITLNVGSSSQVNLFIQEFSGIDPVNPIDASVSASSTGSAVSSGSLMTIYSGDILYGGILSDGIVTAGGTGFSVLSILNGNLGEYAVTQGPGSYAATATNDGSGWVAQAVALKPVSAPTPTPTPVPSPTPTQTTGQLAIGERVQVVNVTPPDEAYIWNMPSNTSGTVLGYEQLGAQGTVIGGPTSDSSGSVWYQFQFDDGLTGYDTQDYFAPAPLASPTPLPSPSPMVVAPTTMITFPVSGSTVPVRSYVDIQASAFSGAGITQVQFFVNGNLKCTVSGSSTNTYSCNWWVPKYVGKTYKLKTIATDAMGNLVTSPIVVVTSQ